MLGTDHSRRNSHAYGLLHAICATAVSDGLIVSNPRTITGVMNPPRQRDPAILSVAEVAALADAVKPDRVKALVLLSAWCGVRWGEVIELRRKDIGKGAEVVMVSRAASHRGKGCRVDMPKSGKARAVVLPPHIREDLKEHLARYVDKEPDALVFPALRYACHFNDSVFAKHFAKAVGRDDVRIHDLRHFAGTQAARVGSVTEVMDRLGHSTPRASLMYQGLASGRAREVADALSALAAVGSRAPKAGPERHAGASNRVGRCRSYGAARLGPVRSRKLGQSGAVGQLASSSASSCSGATTTTPTTARSPAALPIPVTHL